jgi:hypothetical protein
MQRRESNGEGRVQVVIAENTEVHSQLLANALGRDRRIQVVGSVSTSRELLDLVAKFPVDCRGYQLCRGRRSITGVCNASRDLR